MKRSILLAILLVVAALCACTGNGDNQNPDDTITDDTGAADTAEEDAADMAEADVDEEVDEPQLGFEILQIISPYEIIVWIGGGISLEEFNALELPQGWFKNQPRQGEPDGGAFSRSPDAMTDGEFTDAEHFGFAWRHNATVIEANTPIDEGGLLRLNRVAKFHEIRFNAGRTLFVLVSPEGERFVRISRDAGRTSEVPTLPSGWQIVEHVTDEALVFDLPNPTVNIRCDNEDSFQGPLADFDGF